MLRHQGRTPRALDDLQIVAENMVSYLPIAESPKPKPGSTPKPGSAPKPAEWAEYVRPALADFIQHLTVLEKHISDRQDVVDRRNEALALFDRNYSRLVRLAETFEQLSGLESLAKHLRHHPGRPAEQVAAKAGKLDIAEEGGQRDVAGRRKSRRARPKAGPPKVA